MENQLQSFLKEIEDNMSWINDTEMLLKPQMNPQRDLVEVWTVSFFQRLSPFLTNDLIWCPCERPKASLVFWGDMKWDHLPEKGWLNHFQPKFHFYTLWKYQKSSGFLMFSGGIKVEYWLKMGQNKGKRCYRSCFCYLLNANENHK